MTILSSTSRVAAALVAAIILPAVLIVGPFKGHVARVTADTSTVSISDSTFSPSTITVAAGDTVTWTNNDSPIHDITSADGTWTSGILNPGESFSQTFDDPGTYAYLCALHPYMTATVVVQAAGNN